MAVVAHAVALGSLFAGWTIAKPGDTKLVRTSGRAMPKSWHRWVDRSLAVFLHEMGHLLTCA